MKDERIIDLSDIKEDDLDKTSTFTDLMSRSERREYKKEKELEDKKIREENLKEIMNPKTKKEIRQEEKEKRKEDKRIAKEEKKELKEQQPTKEPVEIKNEDIKPTEVKESTKEINTEEISETISSINLINEEELSKTSKLLDFTSELTNTMKLNMQKNIEEIKTNNHKKEKKSLSYLTVAGIGIIASFAYFIYTILFTSYQNSQFNLLIDGILLLSMVFIFCISIVSNKTIMKITSIIIYLLTISFIIFNFITTINI